MQIDLNDLNPMMKQQWLQHAVAPRPICFASTISAKGEVNLSPFSFFNLFSTNPPILIFSPSRRVRDNSIKHTLENVNEIPEVVINIVDEEMVQQVSLASCEYPRGTNEFIKAGFTEEPATIIRPPMVRESKVKMECRVIEIKSLGTEGGAGNLVICEVLRMHVNDSILNEDGSMIDQRKLHHIARLGGNWYSKVDPSNLFEVEKPNVKLGIGIDVLPETIRTSLILTGNELAQLGNVHEMPVVDPAFDDDKLKSIFQYYAVSPDEMEREIQLYAKELLEKHKIAEAWQVLLSLP
ncbi:flavin reductase family protein [Flavihumibacter sp.]|uniref:flavin reductase family protein n=1 Tax=Flavihumibacter sp. TaxID=1913981 RepID=UPI002FC8FB89